MSTCGETLERSIGDCDHGSADRDLSSVENSRYADCDSVQSVRTGLF